MTLCRCGPGAQPAESSSRSRPQPDPLDHPEPQIVPRPGRPSNALATPTWWNCCFLLVIAVSTPACAVSWCFTFAGCSSPACRLLLCTRLGLLKPVRLTLNGHDLAAVHQPVNQRHHTSGIGKHLVPFLKRPIGGDDGALVLVAPTDQLEQQIGVPVELVTRTLNPGECSRLDPACQKFRFSGFTQTAKAKAKAKGIYRIGFGSAWRC